MPWNATERLKTSPRPGPALFFVEGHHDVSFLLRISEVLHCNDPTLPDLVDAETIGRVIFVPTCGDLARWVNRFAPLGLREFHLYDREVPPVTEGRRQMVAAVNRRPNCVAVLTRKRAIENYLHADAIVEATGVHLEIDDETDVPERLAQGLLAAKGGCAWDEVPRRGRRKLREKANRLLNTLGAEMMTPQRLVERDPQGEVIGWLVALRQLMDG